LIARADCSRSRSVLASHQVLEIVLPDHSRLALVDDVTIGRAAENTVRLSDPSVSRVHARISAADGTAVLEDVGSSYGTWLDGRRIHAPARLRPGSRIRLGNQELIVDRPRADDEAGPTIVVPDAATVAQLGGRPRVRSGYALKRLEAGEGSRRWVLEDRRSGRLVRLSDADAELFALIDGTRSLADLAREAERRLGASGPARLTLLLASLGERGLLAGSDERPEAATRRLRRLVAPRQLAWSGAAAFLDRLYRDGGWILVSGPARVPLGVLAALGAVVFVYLVVGSYGTPFVVAEKVGLGGIVFLLGRLAVAAVHETAHGMMMASFGRRVREAGLKLVLVFPYVYVDTSEAWFEPRRRRIAVSAAGPASEVCLGGTFALCCLAAGPGPLRDVLFQLAFGAYVAAFFNLNPMVERDGYHILVDVLREPGLRRRARAQLRRRIAEGRRPSDSAVLLRYSAFGLAWTAAGASIAAAMSLRYEPTFAQLAPTPLVWAVMLALWVLLLVPVLAAVGPPLRERLRVRAR
jgi:pSer/pThr/pTyr-binding forkhead associated (FHA) protein/Zn-dependent protease